MNKIVNVNLGGFPFTIDEAAYHRMSRYITTIKNHFSDSEGCDDIVYDIEVRMAELFQENMSGKAIISEVDLDQVIKILGRPEDFGAASIDEDEPITTTKRKKKRKHTIKTGKKLFRNPEDKVIAGVCSGLSAYLGIKDSIWIRLAFIILGLSMTGVLIYIVLAAIIPEALTAGDRLEMKGEPVNVNNIAKTIEEELTELGDKITEMTKDLGNEFKSKKKILSRPPSLWEDL